MRISDWSSDVCSSDLDGRCGEHGGHVAAGDTGDASYNHVGTAGARDRQGRGRRRPGEEEAGGLFLMSDGDVIYKTDALIAEDIAQYLEVHQHTSLLRFITCGSVDDGKSTLIGRLLYRSKMIFEEIGRAAGREKGG